METKAHTPIYSVILAAGKGRRMRNEVFHKVCFQIAGIPAIHRALQAYNQAGVVRNVCVVGELAGQVVETVGKKFRNVVFAYQPDQLGTADAARCGLRALNGIDPDDRILVVAGDKIIDNAVLSRLINECEQMDADLGVLVAHAEWGGANAGRLLFGRDGRPLAIVEMADIKLRACRAELRRLLETSKPDAKVARDAQPAATGQMNGPNTNSGVRIQEFSNSEHYPVAELQAVINRHLGHSATLDSVFEQADGIFAANRLGRNQLLDRLAELPCDFRIGAAEHIFSAAKAADAEFRNESVYLVKKKAIDYGLEHLPTNNAQGELYLTDAIGAVFRATEADKPRYRVCHVPTNSRFDIMSYNNPEELLQIEDHFHGQRQQSLEDLRGRLGNERLKTVGEWLTLFPSNNRIPQQTRDALVEYYGDDAGSLDERYEAYRTVLQSFRDHFGEQRHVLLVRSPGRINIMGRHIDWQGGCCNLMAVTQEVLMAVSPRSDDLIEARNVDPKQFPDVSISIGQLVSKLEWADWLSVVNSSELIRHLRESAGNWSLYIEAAMLRLQMAYRDHLLRGIDIAVNGNIPVAAGLSSSSALVVATAESALALHGLDINSQQFVNFCGEGEWFVGTRGGSADHAAMKYGEKGTINHVSFHEFELLEQLTFPDSHAMIVCNSFVQAKKAGGAKEAFNSRVGSYLVGVELAKRRFPQFAPFIKFVRDINAETLRVPPSKIYEILLQLPESMTAAEVRSHFQDDASTWQALAPHFDAARNDAVYPVRGVIMFGIAECARAVRAADYLQRQEMDALGALMKISHDGERRFVTHADGSVEPFAVEIGDAAIQGLIGDLTSQDPVRIERAQLHNQPGAYSCSTQEIDTIVDLACRTPGVAGAQIAGAGLGGCAMVLVKREDVPLLEENLVERFYEANELPSGIITCMPSAGSCLVAVSS